MRPEREQLTRKSSGRHRTLRRRIGRPATRSTAKSTAKVAAQRAPAPADALLYATLQSPLGPVLLVAGSSGLKLINFQSGSAAIAVQPQWLPAGAASAQARGAATHSVRAETVLSQALLQLGEYFAGRRYRFELPLDADGSPFLQQVWAALREISYGETITYGELARRIGRPTATRAVGAANGRNPLPVVVPCHRVIGSDGTLTGYHGGLHLKAWLLQLERAEMSAPPAQSAQLQLV